MRDIFTPVVSPSTPFPIDFLSLPARKESQYAPYTEPGRIGCRLDNAADGQDRKNYSQYYPEHQRDFL